MKRFEDTGFNPEILQKLGEVRLALREGSNKLFYLFIGKILKEVSRRNKVSLSKEIFYYDYIEIVDLVDKGRKVNSTKIADRVKGFAVLRKGSEYKIFSKKDADIFWKQVQELVPLKGKKEIHGSVAFRGLAQGRARIIFQRKKKDLHDYGMRRGEILVTDMTKPDMILACKKAVAIVTDEGGITCHAAIISRELKKPCIVGTKVGTQVIKTGDLIEVNANNGSIKILKRK